MNKRLVSTILVLTLIFTAFTVIPVGAADITRDPYTTFAAVSFDDSHVIGGSLTKESNGAVRNIYYGSYLIFKNLDFSVAPTAMGLETCCAADSLRDGYFEIRLDSLTGKILGGFPSPATAGWGAFEETMVSIPDEIKGIHDLYIIFKGANSSHLRNIRFVPTDDSVTRMPSAKTKNAYGDIADDDEYRIAETLIALGLLEEAESGVFGGANDFTVEEAFNAAAIMAGVDFEAHLKPLNMSDAELFSVFRVKKDYNFNKYVETDPITLRDMTGLLLGSLGWLDVADHINTDIMNLGSKLKLFDGISNISGERIISKTEAARLIYNALDATVLFAETFSTEGVHYKEIDDLGIMAIYNNTYRSRGIVEANQLTTLFSPVSSLRSGQVVIDGEVYEAGQSGVAFAIGYAVDFYYEYDKLSDTKTILYYEIVDEQTEVINSDELIAVNMSGIEYEKKNKSAVHSFNPSTPVIFNDKLAQGYSTVAELIGNVEEFKGDITLIDNDRNGKADVIRINSYKSVKLSRFSAESGTISDLYGNHVDMKNGKDEYEFTAFNPQGGIVDITLYPSGTVLDVAMSKNVDGKSYVKVIINDKYVYGRVNKLAMNTSEVFIDGVCYKMAPELLRAIEIGKADAVKINDEGSFYFDSLGNIVAFDKIKKNIVGIIKTFGYSDKPMQEVAKIMLFTYTGETVVADFAKKATVDGAKFADCEQLVGYLRSIDGLVGTPATYRMNGDGDIILLDTVATLAGNDSDKMKTLYNGRKRAYIRNGVFTGDACAVWEGGTIFKTPFPNTEDYENTAGFGVLTAIRTDNSLFDIYSSKGDEVKADIVVDLADSATWRYDKILVEDIYNTLLDDGTVSKGVSGRKIGHGRKGEKVELLFDSVGYTENLSDTLKPGDIINASYNIEGKIINTSSASELPVGKDPSSLMADSSLSGITATNGMGDYAEFAVGEVLNIDDSYIFIEQTSGVKKAYSLKNSTVLCFNTDKGICYDASLNDLKTREDSMVGTRVLIGDDYKIATTILFYE